MTNENTGYLEIVKKNGHALRYVRNQTEALCLEAVKQNGLALEYIRNSNLQEKIRNSL